MKQKIKYFLIITGLVIIGLIAFYFLYLRDARDNELKKEASELVIKIESFRKHNGRLPESLSELGIKETEEGPLYYDKQDSINYNLSFGTSLGESETYHSDSKKWTPY